MVLLEIAQGGSHRVRYIQASDFTRVNNGKSKARSHRATHPCATVTDASKIILHVDDKIGPDYKDDNSHIPGPEKHRMV